MGIVYQDKHWALGVLNPHALKDLTFVPRWGEADDFSPHKVGYQRKELIEEHRVGAYAKYLVDELGVDDDQVRIERPTAITIAVRLALDEVPEFVRIFNRGGIAQVLQRYGARIMAVLDGQHRKLGMERAAEMLESAGQQLTMMTPCVLQFGMTFFEEARLFATINSKQTRVRRALVEISNFWEGEHNGSSTHEHMIRKIAWHLMDDAASPFKKIDVSPSGARMPNAHLTYEGLRRATSHMWSPYLYQRVKAVEDPIKVTLQYWQLVAEACRRYWVKAIPKPKGKKPLDYVEPPQSRLTELVGIASVAKLGANVIETALSSPHPTKRMRELVMRLKDVDWTKKKAEDAEPGDDLGDLQAGIAGAGFAGQKELYTRLAAHVYAPEGGLRKWSEEDELTA
jgi:DGQHR domain-containing protein